MNFEKLLIFLIGILMGTYVVPKVREALQPAPQVALVEYHYIVSYSYGPPTNSKVSTSSGFGSTTIKLCGVDLQKESYDKVLSDASKNLASELAAAGQVPPTVVPMAVTLVEKKLVKTCPSEQ